MFLLAIVAEPINNAMLTKQQLTAHGAGYVLYRALVVLRHQKCVGIVCVKNIVHAIETAVVCPGNPD